MTEITDVLAERYEVRSDDIAAYCDVYLGDRLMMYCLVEVLFFVFRPDVGITFDPAAVDQAGLGLMYDKDGLVCGSIKKLEYRKEGILVSSHYVPYAVDLTRYGLDQPDGLVDRMLKVRKTSDAKHFGVAVDGDVVMDRRYHADLMKKRQVSPDPGHFKPGSGLSHLIPVTPLRELSSDLCREVDTSIRGVDPAVGVPADVNHTLGSHRQPGLSHTELSG